MEKVLGNRYVNFDKLNSIEKTEEVSFGNTTLTIYSA